MAGSVNESVDFFDAKRRFSKREIRRRPMNFIREWETGSPLLESEYVTKISPQAKILRSPVHSPSAGLKSRSPLPIVLQTIPDQHAAHTASDQCYTEDNNYIHGAPENNYRRSFHEDNYAYDDPGNSYRHDTPENRYRHGVPKDIPGHSTGTPENDYRYDIHKNSYRHGVFEKNDKHGSSEKSLRYGAPENSYRRQNIPEKDGNDVAERRSPRQDNLENSYRHGIPEIRSSHGALSTSYRHDGDRNSYRQRENSYRHNGISSMSDYHNNVDTNDPDTAVSCSVSVLQTSPQSAMKNLRDRIERHSQNNLSDSEADSTKNNPALSPFGSDSDVRPLSPDESDHYEELPQLDLSKRKTGLSDTSRKKLMRLESQSPLPVQKSDKSLHTMRDSMIVDSQSPMRVPKTNKSLSSIKDTMVKNPQSPVQVQRTEKSWSAIRETFAADSQSPMQVQRSDRSFSAMRDATSVDSQPPVQVSKTCKSLSTIKDGMIMNSQSSMQGLNSNEILSVPKKSRLDLQSPVRVRRINESNTMVEDPVRSESESPVHDTVTNEPQSDISEAGGVESRSPLNSPRRAQSPSSEQSERCLRSESDEGENITATKNTSNQSASVHSTILSHGEVESVLQEESILDDSDQKENTPQISVQHTGRQNTQIIVETPRIPQQKINLQKKQRDKDEQEQRDKDEQEQGDTDEDEVIAKKRKKTDKSKSRKRSSPVLSMSYYRGHDDCRSKSTVLDLDVILDCVGNMVSKAKDNCESVHDLSAINGFERKVTKRITHTIDSLEAVRMLKHDVRESKKNTASLREQLRELQQMEASLDSAQVKEDVARSAELESISQWMFSFQNFMKNNRQHMKKMSLKDGKDIVVLTEEM